VTTSIQPATEASQPGTILEWMAALRAAVRDSELHAALDFDGIDALEVLLSPIYLAVLNTVRKGGATQQAVPQAILSAARLHLYRLKNAWRERQAAKLSAKGEPVDILLWSRDVTHSVILHPVAEAVRAAGASCSLMACQANTYYGLVERDRKTLYARALWPNELLAAHADGVRRAQEVAALRDWPMPGFPGNPQLDLKSVLRHVLVEQLPVVSEAIANARAALDQLQPKVLVVGNDLTLEGRAGCLVAAQRGVPTAMFMHGSISADLMQAEHVAGRLLVYGNTHRQELIQLGVAEKRVVVCGAPNLDRRPLQHGGIHPELQNHLGLRPNDAWVLVATSGPGHRISHEHHNTVISNLVELCLAFPTLPVVVKLHRKDRLEYYQQGLKDCEAARLVIVAEGAHSFPRSIFDWLQGCSMVLTGASAVAVEAMLMNVPVITMDFRNEIHHVDFIDAQATTHVRSSAELIDAVRSLLERRPSPDRQKHVEHYLGEAFFALDGKSSARGAQALIELIGSSGAQ